MAQVDLGEAGSSADGIRAGGAAAMGQAASTRMGLGLGLELGATGGVHPNGILEVVACSP